MPSALTYPGVYVEEVPSGVRTIMGVPTSIAAFIGRAARGPTDDPITINNYGDFQRTFGGLWARSTLGYAVRDFYRNAPGGKAIIVRLVKGGARASLTVSGMTLEAAHEGTWANGTLQATVDLETRDPADKNLFNLTVEELNADGSVARSEVHRNVSRDPAAARRLDKVLEQSSSLVRYKGEFPALPAAPADIPEEQDKKSGTDGSDGSDLDESAFTGGDSRANKKGLYALEKADIFNLLCIPPLTPPGETDGDLDSTLIDDVLAYCVERRAMFLIDPPEGWNSKQAAQTGMGSSDIGSESRNAAIFFPRLCQPNPLKDNQVQSFAPCGAVAGVFARTDGERGVWKAPAGQDAILNGVPGLEVPLTDAEIGDLNPLGLNCLRQMAGASSRVVWGARTRMGADRRADEWKYIPIRRLALFIEESLFRGTQWVVFEPNDEPLWSSIRLNVGAFMHSLFRRGAFQGGTAREAYLVKCDAETTTQDDRNRGIVNIVVGFAPLKPAEFVVIKIQQLAGQIQT
jgi:phage tail sheath protein FI